MEKSMKVNGKEYEIIKLLGKGKGGYSYLASDGEKKYVLKQIHHEPCDYYQFGSLVLDIFSIRAIFYAVLTAIMLPLARLGFKKHQV